MQHRGAAAARWRQACDSEGSWPTLPGSMIRIGIDLGGTKTEIVALGPDGAQRLRRRAPTPPAYGGVIALVGEMVVAAERELGGVRSTVGIGIPGSLSPTTG